MLKRPPDFIIGPAEKPYLLRWWIIPRNRWFNIYLHKFLRSDDDRALHDHPWASCSIILNGGYFEHTPNRMFWRNQGGVYFRRATAAHLVELDIDWRKQIPGSGIYPLKPVWTLFITGPKVREWGFHCPKGWRHWREFYGVPEGEAHGGEIGKGCE